jgi:hypothetical protein
VDASSISVNPPGNLRDDDVDSDGEAVGLTLIRVVVVVENRVKGLGYEWKNPRSPLEAKCGV